MLRPADQGVEVAAVRSNSLDRFLWRMLAQVPQWRLLLGADEVSMVERRLAGESFADLGRSYGLSPQTIRARLFGTGSGSRRRGGVAGKLRGQLILAAKAGTGTNGTGT